MAKMTGAQAVMRMLKAADVEYLFGLPGSTELNLLDAIVESPNVKYVGALHEGIALGMADGYAQASGKPGVVLVHSSVGTNNALGFIRSAHHADTPMVILSGTQDTRYRIDEPVLDCDLVTLTAQFTKWSWQVSCAEELGKALKRAFKVATTFPRGPVYLAIPEDIQEQQVDFDVRGMVDHSSVKIRGDRDQIRRAAEVLVAAEAPMILAGHQVIQSGAVAELVELAELVAAKVHIPGIGTGFSFPTDHDLYGGQTPIYAFALEGFSKSLDTLLIVGCKGFQERQHVLEGALQERTKVVQIDANPWEVGKTYPLEAAVIADPKSALQELVSEIKGMLSESQKKAIRQRYATIKAAKKRERDDLEGDFVQPIDSPPVRVPRAMIELRKALPANASVVDEACWLSGYIDKQLDLHDPGSFFRQYAHLGWGLAAGVGVALARPDRRATVVIGDGSTLFGIHALWTIARYNVPMTIVVLNNNAYQAIRGRLAWRQGPAFKTGNYLTTDLGDVNLTRIAESFGIEGRRVNRETELRPALREAFAQQGPWLIEVMVDRQDTGYGRPRVPP